MDFFPKRAFFKLRHTKIVPDVTREQCLRIKKETDAWISELFASAAEKAGINLATAWTIHIARDRTILFEPRQTK